HRSNGLAALTQQRHNLAGHAADSPAGTGHQDETRLSHRPPPFVLPAITVESATPPTPAREKSYKSRSIPSTQVPARGGVNNAFIRSSPRGEARRSRGFR